MRETLKCVRGSHQANQVVAKFLRSCQRTVCRNTGKWNVSCIDLNVDLNDVIALFNMEHTEQLLYMTFINRNQ